MWAAHTRPSKGNPIPCFIHVQTLKLPSLSLSTFQILHQSCKSQNSSGRTAIILPVEVSHKIWAQSSLPRCYGVMHLKSKMKHTMTTTNNIWTIMPHQMPPTGSPLKAESRATGENLQLTFLTFLYDQVRLLLLSPPCCHFKIQATSSWKRKCQIALKILKFKLRSSTQMPLIMLPTLHTTSANTSKHPKLTHHNPSRLTPTAEPSASGIASTTKEWKKRTMNKTESKWKKKIFLDQLKEWTRWLLCKRKR